MRRNTRVIFATLLVVIGALSPALADEPDNDITRAAGPLAGGIDIQGVLETDDDVDWHQFYVGSQRQFGVTITLLGREPDDDCFLGPRFDVYDEAGSSIGERESLSSSGESATWTYTSPPTGVSRYLIVAGSCRGAVYSMRIEPPDAILNVPALPEVSIGEPNDALRQASGPLGGGVAYRARLETSNDEDWFTFYTASGRQQVIASVATANDGGCISSPTLSLGRVGDSEFSQSEDLDGGTVTRLRFTSGRARQYALHVSPCEGAEYVLRLDPPTALAGPECAQASRRVMTARRAVRRAIRQSVRRPGRASRRELRAARRALGRARVELRRAC